MQTHDEFCHLCGSKTPFYNPEAVSEVEGRLLNSLQGHAASWGLILPVKALRWTQGAPRGGLPRRRSCSSDSPWQLINYHQRSALSYAADHRRNWRDRWLWLPGRSALLKMIWGQALPTRVWQITTIHHGWWPSTWTPQKGWSQEGVRSVETHK